MNKTIKIGYNIVEGFGMLTSKQTLYYIAENFLASIFIYDDDWNNISLKNLFFNVNYIIPIGSNLFITGYNHIWKTDDQLNILNQYAPSESAGYFGIYYNSTSNFIYVASYLTNSIQLFDMSLIFSSNISTLTHIPWSIAGYNNQIFAGTKDGIILVIINKIIINQFNGCNGNTFQLISILFDEFDHMATACSNQQLYLYSSKGSYQNNNISTLNSKTTQITYDSNLLRTI